MAYFNRASKMIFKTEALRILLTVDYSADGAVRIILTGTSADARANNPSAFVQ